jgi:hypothetical protein
LGCSFQSARRRLRLCRKAVSDAKERPVRSDESKQYRASRAGVFDGCAQRAVSLSKAGCALAYATNGGRTGVEASLAYEDVNEPVAALQFKRLTAPRNGGEVGPLTTG